MLVFPERFQLLAPYQCWEMMENANVFLWSKFSTTTFSYTVWCCYIAVSFLQFPPIWCVCCDFQVWFMFCCSQCSTVCRIAMNWNGYNGTQLYVSHTSFHLLWEGIAKTSAFCIYVKELCEVIMTLRHGNGFRISGPLWWDSLVTSRFFSQRTSNMELWYFLSLAQRSHLTNSQIFYDLR